MKKFLLFAVITFLSNCATNYGPLSGKPSPEISENTKLGTVVGVSLIENSEQSNSEKSISQSIATKFSEELRNKKVFEVVVYPYTEHAQIKPDYVIELTVDNKFDGKMGQNTIKAVLIGGSLFLLSPVLPIKFDLNLDVNAQVKTDEKALGDYEYDDVYQFQYTMLLPNREKLNSWPEDSIQHAVNNVIEKMLSDKEAFNLENTK